MRRMIHSALAALSIAFVIGCAIGCAAMAAPTPATEMRVDLGAVHPDSPVTVLVRGDEGLGMYRTDTNGKLTITGLPEGGYVVRAVGRAALSDSQYVCVRLVAGRRVDIVAGGDSGLTATLR